MCPCKSASFKCIYLLFVVVLGFALFVQVLIPHTSKAFFSGITTPAMQMFVQDEYTLIVGERVTLRVNSLNVRVVYTTSDFKVASVNQNGTVKAKRAGTAIIYGTIKEKKISCRIRVIDK